MEQIKETCQPAMPDVFLTIDIEFGVGSLLKDPDAGAPVTDEAVYCTVDGRSHGLGFVLETLQEFDLKATFFVEAAHALVLGLEPMRPVVAAIRAAGHDLQLHLHPIWRTASARFDAAGPPTDSMEDLDETAAGSLIDVGLGAFESWAAPRPIAFRAGNLQIGRATYRALARRGIAIASSTGLAIHRAQDRSLRIENGRRWIEGVLEIPVLTYSDVGFGPYRHLKNLTITGAGRTEALSVLERSRVAGVSDIVILTHPFEFVKRRTHDQRIITANPVNQRRFKHLCSRLAHMNDLFTVRMFSQQSAAWLADGEQSPMPISAAPWASSFRLLENKLNDLIWSY